MYSRLNDEAQVLKQLAITPFFRRQEIGAHALAPSSRAASTAMFMASSSSCRPKTRQLMTQLSISRPSALSRSGRNIITLTSPLSPKRSIRRNCRASPRARHEARDFLGRVAPGRGVELIGLVDELGGARQIDWRDGPYVSDISSPRRKSSMLSMRARRVPLRVGRVLFAAVAVLSVKLTPRSSRIGEAANVVRRISR